MYHFPHESLAVYQLARDLAREYRSRTWPRGDAKLRDQGVRAAVSVVLNIAEGRSKRHGHRQYHYEIALGSAAEVTATLDLAPFPDAAELQEQWRRVGGMLTRLMNV